MVAALAKHSKVRLLTYAALRDEVLRFAATLPSQGAAWGGRVIIYIPMVARQCASTCHPRAWRSSLEQCNENTHAPGRLARLIRSAVQTYEHVVFDAASRRLTPATPQRLAWYHPRQPRVGLEIFYNIAATNWLYVTPDIQAIELAVSRSDLALLTGRRVQMRL
jgi:hypothetical protein